MLNVTLKGLWAHKRRLVGTRDRGVPRRRVPLRHARARRHAASQLRLAVHRGQRRHRRRDPAAAASIDDPRTPSRNAASIDASLRRHRRAASTASPPPARSVEGFGQLVGKDGDAIGGNGPPTLAGQLDRRPRAQPVPHRRGPRAACRRRGRDQPGRGRGRRPRTSATRRSCRRPSRSKVKIVGIATFGDEDGLGASTFTAFTLAAAQEHLTNRPDEVTSHPRAGRARRLAGTSSCAACGPCCPTGVEAITGAKLTDREHRRHQQRVPRRAAHVPGRVRRHRAARRRRSASTTRSRSSSPSAPVSRPCCGRSARRGARSSGRSSSEAVVIGVLASVAGRRRRARHRDAAEGDVRRLRVRAARRRARVHDAARSSRRSSSACS